MIQEYANVLSQEDFAKAVEETTLSDLWGFKQQSGSLEGMPEFKFWFLDLSTNEFFKNDVANKIKELIGTDFIIERLYANGQTYGLPGGIHTDVDDVADVDLYKTFILYTHPLWRLDWGGTTVIVEDKKEVSIIPKPNHGVLFDSNLPHIGTEPSRHCTELRVSVAYKIRLLP